MQLVQVRVVPVLPATPARLPARAALAAVRRGDGRL